MCVFCVQIAWFDIHSHKNLTLDFFFGRCLFMFSLEFDVINNKHNTHACVRICAGWDHTYDKFPYLVRKESSKSGYERKKKLTHKIWQQTFRYAAEPLTIHHHWSYTQYTYINGRVHWHIKQKNNLSKTTNSKAWP